MKKNALRSKTILGILTAAAGLAGAGSMISSDPAVAASIDRWAGVAGLVLALYGRVKASGGISLLPAKDVPPAA